MTEREFYNQIEGRNEDEQAKAMITASIVLTSNDEEEVAALDNISVFDGAVYLAVEPNNLSMIDVMFDEPTDYEYLQLGQMLEKFNEVLRAYNNGKCSEPLLTLTICRQNDVSAVLTVVNAVWSYIPTSPDKVCTGIRFIVLSDNLHFTELTDEQIDLILDEVGEEMLQDDFLNE